MRSSSTSVFCRPWARSKAAERTWTRAVFSGLTGASAKPSGAATAAAPRVAARVTPRVSPAVS